MSHKTTATTASKSSIIFSSPQNQQQQTHFPGHNNTTTAASEQPNNSSRYSQYPFQPQQDNHHPHNQQQQQQQPWSSNTHAHAASALATHHSQPSVADTTHHHSFYAANNNTSATTTMIWNHNNQTRNLSSILPSPLPTATTTGASARRNLPRSKSTPWLTPDSEQPQPRHNSANCTPEEHQTRVLEDFMINELWTQSKLNDPDTVIQGLARLLEFVLRPSHAPHLQTHLRTLSDFGAHGLIIHFIKTYKKRQDVLLQACRVLIVFAHDLDQGSQRTLLEEGIPVLVLLLRDQSLSETLHFQACTVLYNIALRSNAAGCRAMVKAGGIAHIFWAVRRYCHSKSARFQRTVACPFIKLLLQRQGLFPNISKAKGFTTLLQVVDAFPNDREIQQAARLNLKLFLRAGIEYHEATVLALASPTTPATTDNGDDDDDDESKKPSVVTTTSGKKTKKKKRQQLWEDGKLGQKATPLKVSVVTRTEEITM